MPTWYITDYSRTEILITDLWREWIIPKFRIEMVVDEPTLNIYWNDREKGDGGDQRLIQIDYLDVVDGYSGYASNPSSASDLRLMIMAMIDSAWTDVGSVLTDDEIDAIQGADSPSGSNVFITQSALTTALVANGGMWFMPDLFRDGQDIGIGTNRTLTSLGYTNGTAATAWPKVNADARFTIDVTTMFIDWIVLQETFLTMEQECESMVYSPGGRAYMTNQALYAPRNQDNWACSGSAGTRSLDEFVFNWSGSAIINGTANSFITLDRFPADQTEATSDFLNTTFTINDMIIKGNAFDLDDSTNYAIRLAASSKSSFNNCRFSDATVTEAIYFGIGCSHNNCEWINWGIYGQLLSTGQDTLAYGGGWTGATNSNAQTNQTQNNNNRFVLTTNTSLAAIYQYGGYAARFMSTIIEGIGGDPVTETMIHYQASGDGVEQLLFIDGLSVENLTATRAGIRIESEKGMSTINNVALYLGDPDNQMPCLIEGDNRTGGSGRPTITFTNSYCFRPFRSIENTATPSFQFYWIIDNAYPVDPTDVFDAGNWLTDLGGAIPDAGFIRYNNSIFVDGTTITGDGTIDNPLIANGVQPYYIVGTTTSFVDSATYIFSNSPLELDANNVANLPGVKFPSAGTIIGADFQWHSAGVAGSNESITMNLILNGTTTTAIASVGDTNAKKDFRNMAMSIAINTPTTDFIHPSVDTPAWGTNPTSTAITGYIYFKAS